MISVAELMSKKSRRNNDSESFSSDSENSILMDEISEKSLNEELNKLFLVKIQLRRMNI